MSRGDEVEISGDRMVQELFPMLSERVKEVTNLGKVVVSYRPQNSPLAVHSQG